MILLTTSFMHIILILLLAFSLFKRFRKLLFISKYLKWLILFYLLFNWAYSLIGIELVKSIVFAIAFTVFCFIYRNESKWHKIFITILIVVLSLQGVVHYMSLTYWKYSIAFKLMNTMRGF